MTVFAVIPVKPLAEGKSRLGPVLDRPGREALNRRFLARTLDIAARVPGPDRTIVVSADETVLAVARARGAIGLAEDGGSGLNGALNRARREIAALGGAAMLVLPVDLPLLAADDVRALLSSAKGGASVVIAPDSADQGTNALLLAPPDALDFHFGAGSLAAHEAAARQAGMTVKLVRRPGLAFDVDTPEDYARLMRKTESA